MNSFQIALEALERNHVDASAHKALMVCNSADNLLEALQMLAAVDFGAGGWTDSAELAAIKARAAIAKATGGAK